MNLDFLKDPSLLRFDSLSTFVGGFICLFFLLVIIYSVGHMKGRKGLFRYYLYTILTCIVSLGAVFANNLLLFLIFWGFLGLLLYLLITFGRTERTPATAKKAFIIIGGTDALMLLGIVILWRITEIGSSTGLIKLNMDQMSIPLAGPAAIVAFLCLAAGALAKAGAVPFHTWVPDTAEDAPIPVTAYLPASLDKLLGIYFLFRITLEVFQVTGGMNLFLMAIGSFTIVAAVMMALVQHNLKRLLGYHAVSQVGYMVLGIGTGNPIGIAGGLFHMLNHAIYKSSLFLAAGAVEKRSGTSNLSKLGGYAKVMPFTFVAFIIASLAISGVPPFNGFASKWLLYQGVIETGKSGGDLWIIWLVAAMFGSALTLASFMKLTHTVFLGQKSVERKDTGGKTGLSAWIPLSVLSLLCIAFGVFANRLPLKYFINPAVGEEVAAPGIWNSGLATIMILIGLGIGFVIYLAGSLRKARTTEIFVGGETVKDIPEMRVSGVEFFKTVKDLKPLKAIYNAAEKKYFDIYDVGNKIVSAFSRFFGSLHNGLLPRYITWCLAGVVVLIYILIR